MKVVIIGAGPAGLFAANRLCEKAKVTVIEQKPFAGGSGLHSDGKLNFHPQIGGDLTEFLPESEAWDIVSEIDHTFGKYSEELVQSYDEAKLKELEARAARVGIKFIPIRQKHIGTDRLQVLIRRFSEDLQHRSTQFLLNTKVRSLKVEDDKVRAIITDKGEVKCDYVVMTPGRSGSLELKPILDMLAYQIGPVDIGVRVEVPNSVMSEIIDYYNVWDPKFHIRSDTYDDFVRTFCTCPSGFVVIENYEKGVFGVNGHSLFAKKSSNTNFGFLVRINLTEPLEDTTEYGRAVAKLANTLGGKKPLIQRLGDLVRGRRSTWERIQRNYVEPTMKNATPGDITMAFPHRIVQDLLEGLDKLSQVIPGLNSDSTLLYAPEIKFTARRIETTGFLQTKIANLFVAGDGAGVSRGIVGAAATGILAARGILREVQKVSEQSPAPKKQQRSPGQQEN